MKVRLSGGARAYLLREAAYLRRHNLAAAGSFLARMARARETLSRFPGIGIAVDRLPIPGAHRLVVGDYLLDYEINPDGVLVTAIRHGAQRESSGEFDDEDFDYEA